MYRKSWRSLNGWWEFDFYDDNFVYSHREKIFSELNQRILVPFTYQSSLSGIGTNDIHTHVVYRRKVRLTDQERNHRLLLHFGAVDFFAEVWVDDAVVGSHKGGYTPFYFDITPYAAEKKEITVSLIVEDKPGAEQPRGKQSIGAPFECWYSAVTGIWQSVWLEFLPDLHIETFSVQTDATNGTAFFHLRLSKPVEHCRVDTEVTYKGNSVLSLTSAARYPATELNMTIPDVRRWSPEEPNIYEVSFSLMAGEEVIDRVETYIAFREVGLSSDGLYINQQRYFQKLILMQGFWVDGGYTAPEAESFERDIQLAKEMGFNGSSSKPPASSTPPTGLVFWYGARLLLFTAFPKKPGRFFVRSSRTLY
ncbi:MAG TPA: hypothetical protein ENN41_00475 [Sediminispirochaeta sp.]|nr:hypothetical protein [Sediminispirochaeta sp.]